MQNYLSKDGNRIKLEYIFKRILKPWRVFSKGCHSIITQPNGKCVKRTCDSLKNQLNAFYKSFEININVTDHTGTMSYIRASSKPFEKLIEFKVLFKVL